MASLTQLYHQQPYNAISPSLPSNSQVGRTVMITGSTEGIGFAIAKAFVSAGADVILLSRRENAIQDAVDRLQKLVPNTSSKVTGRVSDIGSLESSQQLWKGLQDEGIVVDVLVLNAASTAAGSIKQGLESIWSVFEFNVNANLRMVQQFVAQGSDERPKALLNISSFMAHSNPAPTQGAYSASKAAFANLLQHLAEEYPAEQLLILNIHPGAILTESAKRHGFIEESLPWDSGMLLQFPLDTI
jgi:NAD(P)-dependent dehydrogenase (short-subunit alcohol dehydrogenase family)